ncbi:MAG: tetratricopeptide repeat protein [Flavobacteriales bacterium]|nr:tetratricopeptide repeat protein [Flavobacteriales bacterium]
MIRILLILICLTSFISSFACINEYRTLLSGKVIETDPTNGKIWTKEIDTTELRLKADNLFIAYENSGSLESFSDYGAALIYLGELQKAKSIYEKIETESPNLYSTASNLGTIYELIGKPDSALTWIKKSIELNPKSHKGSEWIHIKILEFKISGSNDYEKSILGLDFGIKSIPSNPNSYELEQLQSHIWHQLRERSNFVKPKNRIVGNIYFDLGNIIAQTRDVQAALESFEAAKEYGFESELMHQRNKEFEILALKAKPSQLKEDTKDFIRDNFKVLFWSGLATVLFAIILFITRIVKRRNKRTKG